MTNIRTKLSRLEATFTKTEHKIATYVLNHLAEISDDSSQELAQKIGVGQSSIIKFISKVGFEGYTEFKVILKAETITSDENENFSHGDISLENNLEDVAKAITTEFLSSLTDTVAQLNFDTVETIISELEKAGRIYVFGKGSSMLPALDLSSKLMKIGLPVVFYHDLDSIMAAALSASSNDIFLAFTFSGQTSEIIKILQLAQKNEGKIITITKNVNSDAGYLADWNLEIISSETLMRTAAMSSIMAFFSIVDILFLGLIKRDLPIRLEKINQLSSNARK